MCTHHWIIDEQDRGVCIKCDEPRQFPHDEGKYHDFGDVAIGLRYRFRDDWNDRMNIALRMVNNNTGGNSMVRRPW